MTGQYRREASRLFAAMSFLFPALVCVVLMINAPDVLSATYSRTVIPYAWIDASSHTHLTASSSPHRFYGGETYPAAPVGAPLNNGCGTTIPVIDDAISDAVPIGFAFQFGASFYTSVRISSNGRIQFNSTVCGYGTAAVGPPQTYWYTPFPNANMDAVMRIYGADLDPTPYTASGYSSSITHCGTASNPNCFVSYATIGSAPNRKFVVTWNHVPEWISLSSSTGDFNLQLILNEDGTFVYQFGVNVQPSLDEQAETGWQLTTSDYDSVSVSQIQPNNSAIQFAPVSLAPLLHHLEISAPTAQGATCQPTTFTITACHDELCTRHYTGGVNGIFNVTGTATVNWSEGIGSYSIPVGAYSVTKTIQVTTPSSPITLGLSATPVPAAVTTCNFGGSTSCSYSAVTQGFTFHVPQLTACQTSAAVTINGCGAGFANLTRSVKFYTSYLNPSSGTKQALINGSAVATSSTGTTLSLPFDASGNASITVQYPDAGQVQLNLSYTGSSETGDLGLTMTGSSSFLSVPAGFAVYPSDSNAVCAAGDSSCPVYKAAGAPFGVSVKAACWASGSTDLAANPATPNFVLSGMTLSPVLVAPNSGTAGSLGVTSFDFSAADAGVHTIANQTISEVGVFRLSVVPPLYQSVSLSSATSANLGRFIPDYFTVTSPVLTNRHAASCSPASNFSYLGEAMGVQFAVTALNLADATTQNYVGAFARLDPTHSANWLATYPGVGLAAANGATSLTSRLSVSNAAGTWVSGTAMFSAEAAVARSTAPDGPFDSTALTVKPKDSDGVTSSTTTVGTSRLRFGRLRLQNAYGSELLAQPVPLTAEYYNGSRFVTNADDSCTGFVSIPIIDGAPVTYRAGDLTLSHPGGSLTVNAALPSLNAALAGGVGHLLLSAPGSGKSGSLDLTLSAPDWLDFDWDGDGQYDDDPVARIVLGVHKQNPLDRREAF